MLLLNRRCQRITIELFVQFDHLAHEALDVASPARARAGPVREVRCRDAGCSFGDRCRLDGRVDERPAAAEATRQPE